MISLPASLRARSLSLAAGWMLASAGRQEVDFGDFPEERTSVEIEVLQSQRRFLLSFNQEKVLVGSSSVIVKL